MMRQPGQQIALSLIDPAGSAAPRCDPQAIEELVASIRQAAATYLVEPGERCRIIAGERRFRAGMKAG